jgi:hypothetical protein
MTEADPTQKLEESSACNQLGKLYSKMGRYPLSVQYFERYYKLVTELANEGVQISTESTPEVAAVQLGIARGKAEMGKFFEHVTDKKNLSALINWKSHQNFEMKVEAVDS